MALNCRCAQCSGFERRRILQSFFTSLCLSEAALVGDSPSASFWQIIVSIFNFWYGGVLLLWSACWNYSSFLLWLLFDLVVFYLHVMLVYMIAWGRMASWCQFVKSWIYGLPYAICRWVIFILAEEQWHRSLKWPVSLAVLRISVLRDLTAPWNSRICIIHHHWKTAGLWCYHILWTLLPGVTPLCWLTLVQNSEHGINCQLWIIIRGLSSTHARMCVWACAGESYRTIFLSVVLHTDEISLLSGRVPLISLWEVAIYSFPTAVYNLLSPKEV